MSALLYILEFARCFILDRKRANKPGRGGATGGVVLAADRRQHVHSDDEDYMPGCHVISSSAGTQHKRTAIGGCDCGVLWPPLPTTAERTSLAMLQQSDTLPPVSSCGGKTLYGTHNSFRRFDGVVTTPDLFLNSTLTTSAASPTQSPPAAHFQPEVTCSATTMSETPGIGIGRHVVTGPHYYESPMFSHHKGLLD